MPMTYCVERKLILKLQFIVQRIPRSVEVNPESVQLIQE
jgi:hypothetical protein